MSTAYAQWSQDCGYRKKHKLGMVEYLYGLTPMEYHRLYRQQKGKCAICRRRILKYARRRTFRDAAVVDHNHQTGEVRGLLCHTCNRALGMLRDSPTLLQRALRHVTR